MPTLIVGLAVVVVSAAGFAVAMFGRRPLPQPATGSGAPITAPVTAARDERGERSTPRRGRLTRGTPAPLSTTAPTPAAAITPRLHVEVPAPVRIRAAFVLALGVLAAAALVGIVVSIVVVGLFTLIG